MEIIFVILTVMLYGAVFGFSYRLAITGFKKNHQCLGRPCGNDHESAAFFTALLWPFGLPAVGVTSRMDNPKLPGAKLGKEEKRRTAEIEEAEHRRKLAKIALEEEQFLTRQLEIQKHD